VPYNNLTSRTDVQALIPERVSQAMMTNLTAQSAALGLSTRIPVATNQTRFPILSALPTAYFVSGDTGLKQTTEVNWANKYLNIEELAAIVPIPEAVLDDLAFDMWGSVQPLLENAIVRALDAAILFGTNKPASWPAALVPAAATATNTVTRNSSAANGGVAQDFNLAFGKVEADGFSVNGIASRTTMKSILRGARDTTGQALLDVGNGVVMGEAVRWVASGLWPADTSGNAEAIVGDWNQSIVGIRQDFTYKVLDQGVITDNTGAIVYNLPQQDMIAVRVVFRVGWQVANTINYEGANDSTQYPFATLLAP
jgi:HK97 family phage major capsid protein